jgi:hypothetical protein
MLRAKETDTSTTKTFGYSRSQGTSLTLSILAASTSALAGAWSWDTLSKNPEHIYLGRSLAAISSLSLLYACKENYRFFKPAQPTPILELNQHNFTFYNQSKKIKLINWNELDTFGIAGQNFIFLLKNGVVYTIEADEINEPLQVVHLLVSHYYKNAVNDSNKLKQLTGSTQLQNKSIASQKTSINYSTLEAISSGFLGACLGFSAGAWANTLLHIPSTMVNKVLSIMGITALTVGSGTCLYLSKKMLSEAAIIIDSKKVISYNNEAVFWRDVQDISIEERIRYTYHTYHRPSPYGSSFPCGYTSGYVSTQKYYVVILKLFSGEACEINPKYLSLNGIVIHWILKQYHKKSRLIN